MIKKKLLIIVPARKNSSSIKDKNIKKVNGKPLIYYSLKSAKEINEKSSEIICSTDSKKIKKISERYGVRTPFIRPKKISGKYSRDIEFVNFTLKKFCNSKILFKYGLILRPTSPIRSKKILNHAYNYFKKKNKLDSIRAVTIAPITPYKMWKMKKNILTPLIKLNLKEQHNMPRQKLPVVYWQTGNFEFFKINYKKKLKSISGKIIAGFEINKNYASDIDNYDDLRSAQIRLKKLNK